YFLLTGRVPFPGGTLAQKIAQHLAGEPEPVEKLRAGVPPAVAAVVCKLMAKRPQDRYQTPAELARAPEPRASPASGATEQITPAQFDAPPVPAAFPGGSVATTIAPMLAPRRPTKFPRRWIWLAGAGALAAVVLLVLVIRPFGGTDPKAEGPGPKPP